MLFALEVNVFSNLINIECVCMCVCVCVHAQSYPTLYNPWTGACQAALSMEFSKQEYWSGLPFPTPGDLPDLGIELKSLAFPTLATRFFTNCFTQETHINIESSLLNKQINRMIGRWMDG